MRRVIIVAYLVKYRPGNVPPSFQEDPPREMIIHAAKGVSWAWMAQRLAERNANAELVSYAPAPYQPPPRERAPSAKGQRGAR